MKETDDIDQLFSSTFDGAEMQPPLRVKEEIDNALFPEGVKSGRRGYWWLGLLAIILTGSTVGILWYTSQTTEDTKLTAAIELNQSAQEENAVEQTDSGTNQVNQSNQVADPRDAGIKDGAKTDENDKLTDAAIAGSFVKNGSKNKQAPGRYSSTEVNLNTGEAGEGMTAGKNWGGKDKSLSTGFDGASVSQSSANQTGDGGVESGINKQKQGISAAADNTFENSMSDAKTGATEHEANLSDAEQEALNVFSLDTHPAELLTLNSVSSLETSRNLQGKGGGKINRLSLALYTGGTYGVNSLKSTDQTVAPVTINMREAMGYYAGLEVYYPLSHRFSISAGADYSQQKYTLSKDVESLGDVYVGDSIVFVYDTSQAIIDSIVYPIYDQVAMTETVSGFIRQMTIGIPVYAHYTTSLGSRVSLDLGIGARFSYVKYTTQDPTLNLPYPTYKQFGMTVQLRPELMYHFPRLGIGVYGKLEYDVVHGMEWTNLSRRRWGTGAGISLRYKL